MVELTAIPRIDPQVAARLLEDRAIVVLADAGEVLVLNPNGAWIWSQIDGRCTVGELAGRLGAAWTLDPAHAQGDTLSFMVSLAEAGAIVLV